MTISKIKPIDLRPGLAGRHLAVAKNVGEGESTIKLGWVPVDRLFVDDSYQRNITEKSRAKMNTIVADFTWHKVGAIMVTSTSVPQGHTPDYKVIDGQHRAIAAATLGIELVPAVLVPASTEADEASTFIGVNVGRTNVGVIDKFRARVTAGEELAIQLHEILTTQGIGLDVAAGVEMPPKTTRAVSRLLMLMKRAGKGILGTALEMLVDAQPDTPNLLRADTIEAATLAVTRITDSESSIDRLFAVFEKADFDTINDRAHQMRKIAGGRISAIMAGELIKAFNHAQRIRVSEAF